jgi:acetyl esterase/lipase
MVTNVVLTGSASASAGDNIKIHTNIPYATEQPAGSRGHLLDLYVPPGAGRRPLLIVMGGSGWMGDDGKAYAADLAPYFTGRGYVVAGVSTRSSSQAVFPAQVHDVTAAIRWLRAHAARYGIDPGRIAAMGDSSGGWTATMAGVAGDALSGTLGVTGYPSDVQAVVDLYGPTDFLQMDEHMLPGACDAFGYPGCHGDPRSPESALLGCPINTCPDRVAAANPITYVSRAAPPFLIAHGQGDMLVPHHQSELLFAALAQHGVEVTFYSVPGVGHDRGIVRDTAPEATVRHPTAAITTGRPTLATIDTFLRRALGT